jgi:hypothetical protein
VLPPPSSTPFAKNTTSAGLAHVLAIAAAELGSTAALTAGRPGSWEADLVQQLVRGTVGWDDDYLANYARPRATDAGKQPMGADIPQ